MRKSRKEINRITVIQLLVESVLQGESLESVFYKE